MDIDFKYHPEYDVLFKLKTRNTLILNEFWVERGKKVVPV